MSFLLSLHASDLVGTCQLCIRHPCLQLWEWHRLLWSAFLHADETHLYYNMSSFLWKVRQLPLAACSATSAHRPAWPGLVCILQNGCQLTQMLPLTSAHATPRLLAEMS